MRQPIQHASWEDQTDKSSRLGFVETAVAAFFTNGVAVPAGVYKAANVSQFIADSGSLKVGSASPSGPATLTNNVSGSTLTFTWRSGQSWPLVDQTNSLSAGLNTDPNAWFTVPGGIDGGNSMAIDPANPSGFYRLAHPRVGLAYLLSLNANIERKELYENDRTQF